MAATNASERIRLMHLLARTVSLASTRGVALGGNAVAGSGRVARQDAGIAQAQIILSAASGNDWTPHTPATALVAHSVAAAHIVQVEPTLEDGFTLLAKRAT